MADKDINNQPEGNEYEGPEKDIAVKRSGKQVAKLQQRIKVTKWILLSLLLLIIILYLLFLFFWRGGLDGEGGGDEPDYGDFTVQIDKGQRNLISLCETVDFENNATIRLHGSSVDDLWHCTRSCIPDNVQDLSNGGDHHVTEGIIEGMEEQPLPGQTVKCSPNYFAYTFHLKNCSDQEIKYTYDFVLVDKLINNEVDALDAVRVMIVRNGDKVVWAKDSIDGTPLEDNTEIFQSDPYLINVPNNVIQAGEIDKYTVVMWLEGWDPECVNDIFLNTLKFEMNFEVQNKFKEIVDNSETQKEE